MAVRVRGSNLKKLRSRLKFEFKKPFPVYPLVAHRNQIRRTLPLSFWVDKWPHFRAVLSKTALIDPDNVNHPVTANYYTLYVAHPHRVPNTAASQSEDSDTEVIFQVSQVNSVSAALHTLLGDENVIYWDNKNYFEYLDIDLCELVKEEAEMNEKTLESSSEVSYLYSVAEADFRRKLLPLGVQLQWILGDVEGARQRGTQPACSGVRLLRNGVPLLIASDNPLGEVVLAPATFRYEAFTEQLLSVFTEELLRRKIRPVILVDVDDAFAKEALVGLGFTLMRHEEDHRPIQICHYWTFPNREDEGEVIRDSDMISLSAGRRDNMRMTVAGDGSLPKMKSREVASDFAGSDRNPKIVIVVDQDASTTSRDETEDTSSDRGIASQIKTSRDALRRQRPDSSSPTSSPVHKRIRSASKLTVESTTTQNVVPSETTPGDHATKPPDTLRRESKSSAFWAWLPLKTIRRSPRRSNRPSTRERFEKLNEWFSNSRRTEACPASESECESLLDEEIKQETPQNICG